MFLFVNDAWFSNTKRKIDSLRSFFSSNVMNREVTRIRPNTISNRKLQSLDLATKFYIIEDIQDE